MPVLVDVIEKNIDSEETVKFYYLKDGEQPISKTYTEIVLEAKKLASYLSERFEIQSRILLIYPQGIDFIPSFLACLYAGMIAVPAYPLQNPRHAYRLHSIIDSCKPSIILGNQKVIDDLSEIESLAGVEKVATESIFKSESVLDFKINLMINESMLAFLQYTSGSTGTPKGVMISHANLMNNLLTIKQGLGLGPNKTTVLWLPFQHDLGLISGVLSSLYNHNNLVLLSPTSVIEKPYRWLKAITDYKAYLTAGPNFSYQLCVNKISEEELKTLDLSSLHYAGAAAEPNRFETMEQFCRKFSTCGFKREAYCVGYGLAENTLLVSINTLGQVSQFINISKEHLAKGNIIPSTNKENEYRIMSAGAIQPENEIAIVNPRTKMRSNQDEVGEIWIHGGSVAQGYWDNPEGTKETFNAKLKGENKAYLRTGDLGFIHNHELFLTGRLKDLIIVDGRNIYPQDLETIVDNCHEYIKPGCSAAFSVDNGQHEVIVICAEIHRTAIKKDLSEVIPHIRHAIAKHFEVAVYDVKLLRPNRSFKTTSGKIQRKKTRTAYLENTLECIDLEVSPLKNKSNQLASDIEHILEEVLGLKGIEPHQHFSDMGGTSLHATMLYQKLQDYFGPEVSISQTVAFDYPTLAELTEFAKNPHAIGNDLTQEKSVNFKRAKIAIIGIGCRLPGKIKNMDDLWNLLSKGIDAIETIPKWRWDIDHYEDELKNRVSQAGVLEDIDLFDASFFNISPREAQQMDPQHRLLLEVAWQSLENAAISPETIVKKKVGVYIGNSSADYKNLYTQHNKGEVNPYFVLDNATSVMAGRIAYFFGTQGPAETIDTACSSSLVALDAACQALQLGTINMAIAGGVNLILSPENSVGLAQANMLSPTNRCHTFSQDADGYVRSEGCALVILKRLEDAVKDGDIIHAVIQSSAVNQDGASSGLTVPSMKAQQSLLEDALKDANLTPNDIDYIEAHGSATVLGDPIEFGAINAVFGHKNRTRPLLIGSIKSNIGHLEAVAGITGVLKIIAALKHQGLPANIHIDSINPKLDINPELIKIVSENTDWRASNHFRRAGVSSFGFSGTNAHVILEEAPDQAPKEQIDTLPKEQLFILSAKSKKSLDDLIDSYIDYLEKSDEDIADICYTLALGRGHFSNRLAIIAANKNDLKQQLKSKLSSQKGKGVEWQLISDYLAGKEVDWEAYYKPYLKALRKVSLPTYCFDNQRYWLDYAKKDPDIDWQTLSQWSYGQIWEQVPLNPALKISAPKNILVIGFNTKTVSAWGKSLSAADINNSTYLASPDITDSRFKKQLEALFKKHPFKQVILLCEFDRSKDVLAESLQSTRLLLTLIQSLLNQATKPILLIVTAHAQIINDAQDSDVLALGLSPIQGFVKTLQLEHPELNTRLIDVDELLEGTATPSFLTELQSVPENESIIAHRKSIYYAPRVIKQPLLETVAFKANPQGTYLITGGLGSLGQALAKWLIEHGVKHLVLTGRHAPKEDVAARLSQWQEERIDVQVHLADVSHALEVADLINSIQASKHALIGVFHCAGVNIDKLLREMSQEDMITVLKSKMSGAWHLHQLTQKIPLEQFVLFSSITSFVGNTGQANYAAANAFLDQLALLRHQARLPALSINWDAWEVGMWSRMDERLKADIKPLRIEEGFMLLNAAMQQPASNVAIIKQDLQRYFIQRLNLTHIPPYLSRVISESALLPEVSAFAMSLMQLDADVRLHQCRLFVEQRVRKVLGLVEMTAIAPDKGFFDMGMDSLMAMELRNQFQAALGRSYALKQTLVFDYGSINLLSQYLNDLFTQIKTISWQANTPSSEPIAIIGMGCRFPGHANTPEEFWNNLLNGVDGIVPVPEERWDVNEYYSDDLDAEGKMYVKEGGFIANIDQFDAAFFNISPREATAMDPQQRLLLEVAWASLENAGINPARLSGSDTGVFVGVSMMDYAQRNNKYGEVANLSAYNGTGSALSAVSGRLSYVLGLEGPSMVIDTACSSSLTALHEAVKSLHSGECSLAISAGVNLIISPETNITLCRAKMLSPDARCKTFDASANGYVRSDGCGVVILKRLSEALAAGDQVLAVIKGSAVNQDGASGGLTVPNGKAQENLMQKALLNANLKPEQIDFIEAHGTGTSLGDPIEIEAIGAVYGKAHDNEQGIIVGALKSNIGHLESAAGIAGVIKAVLALKHRFIPGNLHFNHINPAIKAKALHAHVASQAMPWDKSNDLRRAAVSSFGFTGTNAHVILEEAPQSSPRDEAIALPKENMFVLSAKSKKSLEQLIDTHMDYLAKSGEDIADICYTLAVGRAHFSNRLAILASDKNDLIHQLQERVSSEKGEPKDKNEGVEWQLISDYLSGKDIDWESYYKPYIKALRKVAIPTYCFDTQRYWLDVNQVHSAHPKLNNRHVFLQDMSHNMKEKTYLFTTNIDARYPDFIKDHTIYGEIIIAGAAYISTMMSFVFQVLGLDFAVLDTFEFIQPLVIPKGGSRTLQIFVKEEEAGEYSFELYSFSTQKEGEITAHATGRINTKAPGDAIFVSIEGVKSQCSNISAGSTHQANVARYGLNIGPHFHWIKDIYYNENELLAELRAPMADEVNGFELYPGLIDASFQAGFVWIDENDLLAIPVAVEHIAFSKQRPTWVHIKKEINNRSSIDYLDATGLVVATLSGFQSREISETMLKKIVKSQNQEKSLCYMETYEPYELPESTATQENQNQTDEHIVFIYEDNFNALIEKAKQLLNNKPASLTLITNKAFAITKETINPNHTKALGFWKSFYQEAGFPCYVIDRQDQEDVNPVLVLIRQGNMPETQLILRDNVLYIPRLVSQEAYTKRHKIAVNNPIPFAYKPEGTYLITGGIGGLGLDLIKHLISKGAKHITVTSRSQVSEASQAWIKEQQEHGIDITHYQADVSDKKAIKEVFDVIANTKQPLKGIFHAAGLVKDGFLKDLSVEDFDFVSAPKVQGSSNLHILSKNLTLDCFVLFSSIASLLGNTGQSNYAAANAFMDGLAKLRRQQGLPALSINWGPFAKVGMAANLETIHRYQGMIPLDAELAFEVLDTLLTNPCAQVAIMDLDWSKVSNQTPYLNHLIAKTEKKSSEWARLCQVCTPARLEQILIDRLVKLVGQVLNIVDLKNIESNKNIIEFGMDSLMAVDLKNRLQNYLGDSIELNATFVFDNPTINQMVTVIMSQTLSQIDISEIKNTALGEIDTMDENELNALLSKLVHGE